MILTLMRCTIISRLLCVFTLLINCILINKETTGQSWTFEAELHGVTFDGDGFAVKTNIYRAKGIRDKTHFTFSTEKRKDPSELETHCGWDGHALYCYDVMNVERPRYGDDNLIDTNREVRPYIDSVPVPRMGNRVSQALSVALISDDYLRQVVHSRTNVLRIETDYDIPEEFSTIHFETSHGTQLMRLLRLEAPGFLWDTRSGRKVSFPLPKPLDAGYVHWEFESKDRHNENHFITQFEFFKYFPNEDAIENEALRPSLPTMALFGTIAFNEEVPSPTSWKPILPKADLHVSDYGSLRDLDFLPETIGIPGMVLRSTDRHWTMNPRDVDAAKIAMAHAIQSGAFNEPVHSRRIFWMLIGIAFLVPLLFLWRARLTS